MSDYQEFLKTKHLNVKRVGFDVPIEDIHPILFAFQRDIVRWSLSLGRAAIFAKMGMGKTFMQLEWAKHVAAHTGKKVLILAPLAVAHQTIKEGERLGIAVKRVDEFGDIGEASIVITNYDRVHKFYTLTDYEMNTVTEGGEIAELEVTDKANQLDPDVFAAIILDESSILKHYSKTFFELVHACETIPYRLCCTATPSPNDIVEIGNHSTFLGVMDFHDMLARFFFGSGKIAREAQLTKHGEKDFWKWLTSWSVCISRPGDLGDEYEMEGFDLPPMHVHEHRLPANAMTIERAWAKGLLIPDEAVSATGFMKVKRETMPERIEKAIEIVALLPETEPVILWCDTDFESDALMQAFPQAIEIRGSYSSKVKEEGLVTFATGQNRMLITKPEIAGFGMNFQHCANMVFIGSSFSFERPYQAIGRIYRFGQKREVNIHWIYSESEGSVKTIFDHKEKEFQEMQKLMNTAMQQNGLFRDENPDVVFYDTEYKLEEGNGWKLYMGDSVENIKHLEDNSVHLCIHSPPFGEAMYTYSDKMADMGNAGTRAEFMEHYGYLLDELHRVMMPGRAIGVHVKDLPLFLNRDSVMGIDPFSDDVLALFRSKGFVLQSRITIGKDPVLEMQKTNSHGLLFKSFREMAQILRVGLPDYVLVFRKWPVEGCVPVTHDPRDTTYFGQDVPPMMMDIPSRKTRRYNTALPVWQRYANPIWDDVSIPAIWTDIAVTKVLNYMVAKESKDQRHICPLQLDLISRLIHWYTNEGETVLDPFVGIGSTVYEAVKLGRVGIGMELKPNYYKLAIKYVRQAEQLAGQKTLFQWAEEQRSPEYKADLVLAEQVGETSP